MLAVYFVLVLFFLVLFVLITPIELTLDAEARHKEEESLLRGDFSIKWFIFSRTFSTEKSGKAGDEGKRKEDKKEKTAEKRTKGDKERSDDREKGDTEKREGKKNGAKERSEGAKRGKKLRIGKKGTKKSKKFGKKELSELLRAFRCLSKPLFRFFSDLLNAVKFRHLDADLSFGLSDPAQTGMLCGFFHGLTGVILGRCEKCRVYIDPVFCESMLDFRGNTKFSIKIYSLVFAIFFFILNRRTLSFIFSVLNEKIHSKLGNFSQSL